MVDKAELHQHMMADIEKSVKCRAELLEQFEMLDEDGYPTDRCVQIIKNWHWSDSKGWFEFIKEYWWAPDFGWQEADDPHEYRKDRYVRRYYLSTGGWSGNETLMRAMEQNWTMWSVHWVQSRRGGHYIFEINKDD